MSITLRTVILIASLLTIYPPDLKTIIGLADVPAGEVRECRYNKACKQRIMRFPCRKNNLAQVLLYHLSNPIDQEEMES
jgi:hypothetical protein